MVNSITSPTEFLLESIDKGEWIAKSAHEFSTIVDNQLKAISKGYHEDTRELCVLQSAKIREQYIKCINKGINKIFEIRNQ